MVSKLKHFNLSIMMKHLLFLSLALAVASAQGQDFTLLGSDPSGDQTQTFGLDAKALSLAYDEAADSLWLQLETHDSIIITEDWGFAIGFDTNEVTTDGMAWNGSSNTSMNYDRKLTFLNNKFFPPTVTSLEDAQGNSITQVVDFTIVNPFTLIIRLKLSDVDDDINMNILAGTGSFDGQLYDDLPDASYFSTRSILSVPDADSEIDLTVYPNPFLEQLTIAGSDAARGYSLYSVSGQLIGSWQAMGNSQALTVDLSNEVAGFYYLQVESKTGAVETHKLIKLNP